MVIKACIVGVAVRNTGKECNIAMGPTAMIIPVPAALTFTIAQIQEILDWALPLMHAAPALRIFPMFGQKAPINTITNNPDSDIIVTLDDGTPVYIRPGIYSRIYETIAGGLCYAAELKSFLNSGMNIIEIDKDGQMLICNTGTKNEDGEKLYRGLIPNFMYAPTPLLADLKTTPYKNRFSYSFDPTEMVNNGEIFRGGSPLLAVMGLIDAEITDAGGTTETTPEVAATRTVTITGVGADNDTIDIPDGDGNSLSDVPVIKTAAETTVTLLAVKVKNAINAATATNGGYTANNAAGVITITSPADLGATVNTVDTAPVIVGTITATHTAFASGVNAVGVIHIGVRTECAETDLVAQIGAPLATTDNFVVIRKDNGATIPVSAAALVSGHLQLTGDFISGKTYTVYGGAPSVWFDNNISGYDASQNGVDILIP